MIYLYSRDTDAGTVLGMDENAVYDARWFDPRTGVYTEIGEVRPDEGGAWKAPRRPGDLDYVLVLRKK